MFTSAADVRQFALAGKAVLTIESAITNTHFTFKITRATDKYTGQPSDLWFVGLLTGPDNESDYSYLGVLDGDGPKLRMTQKSRVAIDAPSVMAFGWAWNNIIADKMPANLVVRHEGKCGRCMHTLTTPESVDTGFGPECSAILGIAHESHTPSPSGYDPQPREEPVVEPETPIKASIDLKQMLLKAYNGYGGAGERSYLMALKYALDVYFTEAEPAKPTMAEIDADVKAGKPVSLMDVVNAQRAARGQLDIDNGNKPTITLPPPPPKKKPITKTEIDTADDVPVF